ncbi:MAG: nucleoside triphosphate pyrophosphohydrolase, partial [Coriobacteriia bacterium]|nr:nucleoside triphosphate pyrophosphohydrolase [Coriobacteriia bacterium]
AAPDDAGLLASVPTALPALMQAQDISRKAVSAGFEWESLAAVWEQVGSELEEYRQAREAKADGAAHAAGADQAAAEEFGDVLFSLCNVARKEGIDAESALRLSCRKFRSRWAIMERYARAQGVQIEDYSTAELEDLWLRAKREIAAASAG